MKIRVPNPDKPKRGRLNTPAPKVIPNKKRYTRKTKHRNEF